MITHRYRLDEINESFDAVLERSVVRGVIVFDQQ